MGLLAKVNSILGVEIPRIRMDEMERPRPYPYDTTAILSLTDGGAPDTFPVGYTQLIPAGTYDFGDGDHNRIQVNSMDIEVMPAGTFIVELYKSADAGATYTPIGAVRVSDTVALTLVYSVDIVCRPLCITHNGLYGRVKTAAGGLAIQFSLSVSRWLPPTVQIPISTGVWPWG